MPRLRGRNPGSSNFWISAHSGQLYQPDGTNVTRYCRDPAYWTPLQREGQLHRRGLWVEPGALPPWEFRHR